MYSDQDPLKAPNLSDGIPVSRGYTALLMALCGWLTAAVVIGLSSDADPGRETAEQFGQALATELAALSARPLMTSDALALAAQTRRLIAGGTVTQAEVRTMTGEVLASAGQASAADRRFVRRIQIDGTDAGAAEISVDLGAFDRPVDRATIAGALILPALFSVLYAWWPLMQTRVSRRRERPRVASVELEAELTDEALGPGERGLYTLVVNLFNQLALDTDQRESLNDGIERISEQVASLYGARLLELPGTGVLLAFEAGSHSDRCFEVVCAALLLAQTLDSDEHRAEQSQIEPSIKGTYRFGLHRSDYPADDIELIDLEAVSDTVLLSATARNSTLVVSEQVFADLDRAERLLFEDQRNLALGALETTGEQCFLVHGVTDSYQVLIERQAELLATTLTDSPDESAPAAS